MPRKHSYDRDALIGRARDLFWKQGWAGTSLKDLERVLHLKPGSFYAAFGSKDRLYALAMERYIQDAIAASEALADRVGAKAALKAQPLSVVKNADAPARACMLAKTHAELQSRNHPLATQAQTHMAAMRACFATLFRAAQASGEIGRDHNPDRLAARFQSDLLGLRLCAEQGSPDAAGIAEDIAADLDKL